MMRIGSVLMLGAAMAVAAPRAAVAADDLAIVDVKKAMRATKHWEDALKKLEERKSTLQKSLTEARDKLQKQADALLVQKGVLAPKNFEKQMASLEAEKQKLGQEFLRSQQQLQFLEKGYAGQLIQRIESVVRKIAYENEFLVIVDSGDDTDPNVLYAKKGLDITPKVIKAYKEAFGKQPLQDPKLPGGQ